MVQDFFHQQYVKLPRSSEIPKSCPDSHQPLRLVLSGPADFCFDKSRCKCQVWLGKEKKNRSPLQIESRKNWSHAWNRKQPIQNEWKWWCPTISCVKSWSIIQLKQPFINGFLGFQVKIISGWRISCSKTNHLQDNLRSFLVSLWRASAQWLPFCALLSNLLTLKSEKTRHLIRALIAGFRPHNHGRSVRNQLPGGCSNLVNYNM